MDDTTAALDFTVTGDDTAAALGSGTLDVLGTPRLLAWLEAATCAALEPRLREGQTSVGARVAIEHLAASPLGATVRVSAEQAFAEGRLVRFAVSARHSDGGADGKLIASGEITRVIVEAERFLARVDAR